MATGPSDGVQRPILIESIDRRANLGWGKTGWDERKELHNLVSLGELTDLKCQRDVRAEVAGHDVGRFEEGWDDLGVLP